MHRGQRCGRCSCPGERWAGGLDQAGGGGEKQMNLRYVLVLRNQRTSHVLDIQLMEKEVRDTIQGPDWWVAVQGTKACQSDAGGG